MLSHGIVAGQGARHEITMVLAATTARSLKYWFAITELSLTPRSCPVCKRADSPALLQWDRLCFRREPCDAIKLIRRFAGSVRYE